MTLLPPGKLPLKSDHYGQLWNLHIPLCMYILLSCMNSKHPTVIKVQFINKPSLEPMVRTTNGVVTHDLLFLHDNDPKT
ncbi:hypothetical protein CDL12_19109 [Handroanthus impetiginosus]|uniref:Uncharacterized protein n=1 Tax=Handroanthus impetiginosus TaxID=429701 RepID=A0A2G9GSS9_9LAMI|nr:hypothetical protein CDL12_19109 [Handroanthus impetiginosus]